MIGHLAKDQFKPDENYDEFYAGHAFEPFPEALATKADEVMPRVAWALDIAREVKGNHVKLLDLCCLDGFAALTLAAKDPRVLGMGIDLSEPGIALARERMIQLRQGVEPAGLVSFVQGDIVESLDNIYKINGAKWEAKDKYDLVLLFEAIEHFQDVDAVIDRIKRRLKPGGSLLVSTPDAEGTFGIANVEDTCHLRVYTHHAAWQPTSTPEGKPIVSLPSYLESQGFTIVENEVWNELIHIRATL